MDARLKRKMRFLADIELSTRIICVWAAYNSDLRYMAIGQLIMHFSK